MKFFKNLYNLIAWRLWRKKSVAREMKRLVQAGPPAKRNNPAIYKTISKEDANVSHYDHSPASLGIVAYMDNIGTDANQTHYAEKPDCSDSYSDSYSDCSSSDYTDTN